MDTSSEYTFPIFISSTDYNLKDLRAELARFLSELGYKPFLSSAEGFPDSSPILEPWESCIPVLEKSFVMVLIIDGRYGDGLKWPNYKEYFADIKISPTHGEYIFAHRNRKRMLVFIRKSLMPHYQSYRTVMKKCDFDKTNAEKLLTPTLPEYVTFQTLDFINEVKTSKPIPWINEFEDITSVKREIQKKMLNELAELFLLKNKHFETVIDSFNRVMDSLDIEKQKEVLQKINATKGIIDSVDKLEAYKNQIEEVTKKLVKTNNNKTEDKERFEKQIKNLKEKVIELEKETLKSSESQFFIKDGQIKLGNPSYVDNISNNSVFTSSNVVSGNWQPSSGFQIFSKKCDSCGKIDNDVYNNNSYSLLGKEFNSCPSCKRYLCRDCWPNNKSTQELFISGIASLGLETCPNCSGKV